MRLCLCFLIFSCALNATAQDVKLRQISSETNRAVYELTASWGTALSTPSELLDAEDLRSITAGGLFERTATLHLPTLATPTVRVLAADFDEIGADLHAEVIHPMTAQPAEVLGLGLYRKKPAATLVMRTATYDGAALRRYRRMLVEVSWEDGIHTLASYDNPHLLVTESILSSGTVFKIPIRQEGIYRIDRTFLEELPGLNTGPGSIDPENVKVYGNGGKPVAALNSDFRHADLEEIPVFVQGGGDGSFDSGDAVWFYGAAPSGWHSVHLRDNRSELRYDNDGNPVVEWQHYVHPYSNDNYYFIKIDGQASTALTQDAYPNISNSINLDQITGRYFADYDEYLWAQGGESGHTWLSQRIEGAGSSLAAIDNVVLPALATGSITYIARPAIRSNPAVGVEFSSGGVVLGRGIFGATTNSVTAPLARIGITTFNQGVSAGQPITITMELESTSGGPQAALDWIRAFYPMEPARAAEPLRLHTPLLSEGTFTLTLDGFSSEPYVLDITVPGSYQWLGTQQAGSSYRIQVTASDQLQPRELIAFDENHVVTIVASEVCPPDPGCTVPTQNLHGITTYPDFVIITPSVFLAQAEELAEIRRSEGLNVEVVDILEVYNEFSGGMQDPRGIRDYLKFLYDRAPSDEELLRYVLLLGDGHYNYRLINPEEGAVTSWIAPYETEESLIPETSYTTDDYFGLLDDNEGLWPFTRTVFYGIYAHLNERVDVGIGRFTVTTPAEAQIMIDKIKHYESPQAYGSWRQRYLFIADDGPTGVTGTQDDKDLHTQNSDVVAEVLDDVAAFINQKKVYGISYPREFLGGWRLPLAKEDILSTLDEGVLVTNYSGHGGEDGLAQEELFNTEDAVAMTNYDVLPIFITATCSFGRWDQSDSQSGAEELLLNSQGGAIALLTTVRTVYTSGDASSLNVGLNVALNVEMFKRDDNGLMPRLGDALLLTKNTRVGYEGNNRKFNLLGDPTMRVGVPSSKAIVEKVNGEDVTQTTGHLRALDRITVDGYIGNFKGDIDPSFDGTVALTVFDAVRQVMIPLETRRHMPNPYYRVREDLIWAGRAKVKGGRFTATFVVPKDISYSNEPGRISLYASSDQGHAQGHTDNVIVGGTAADAPDDNTGPDIELFMGDETFASGGLTSTTPVVLAKIFDESGLNTVGAGVGHEMLLVLDENEAEAINVGNLYESAENSYQEGTVSYHFREELEPGPHTLSMRAWDVVNNSGATSIEFVVTDSEFLVLQNVLNYPNPTTGPSRFVFEHNQVPGTLANIQIRIYSLAGNPIKTIETEEFLPAGAMQIVWDGTDDDFARLSPGVYLYKVRVEVEGDSGERQISEAIEKLAIVR